MEGVGLLALYATRLREDLKQKFALLQPLFVSGTRVVHTSFIDELAEKEMQRWTDIAKMDRRLEKQKSGKIYLYLGLDGKHVSTRIIRLVEHTNTYGSTTDMTLPKRYSFILCCQRLLFP